MPYTDDSGLVWQTGSTPTYGGRPVHIFGRKFGKWLGYITGSALPEDNFLLSSDDMVTWTPDIAAAAGTINFGVPAAIETPSLAIVYYWGDGGAICRKSSDGATWSALTTPGGTPDTPRTAGTQVLVLGETTSYHSTDGASWTTVASDLGVVATTAGVFLNFYAHQVAFFDGLYYLASEANIFTSPDLAAWTYAASLSADVLTASEFSEFYMATSADGLRLYFNFVSQLVYTEDGSTLVTLYATLESTERTGGPIYALEGERMLTVGAAVPV